MALPIFPEEFLSCVHHAQLANRDGTTSMYPTFCKVSTLLVIEEICCHREISLYDNKSVKKNKSTYMYYNKLYTVFSTFLLNNALLLAN